MLRNGLASPFLLGISAGAGLVVVLLVGIGIWQVWVPLGAWAGAVFTAVMVYLLACTRNRLSVERLILSGVAFTTFFSAIQSMLLLLSEDGRVQGRTILGTAQSYPNRSGACIRILWSDQSG